MKQVVNERNAKRVVAWFFDEETGDPINPATVEWNHVCRTTGDSVSDYDANGLVAVAAVTDEVGVIVQYKATIRIPASQNAMRNDGNKMELREIDVCANRGLDDEWSQTVEYYVRNRQGRK